MLVLLVLLSRVARSRALLGSKDLRGVPHLQRRLSLLLFLFLLLRLLSLIYLFRLLVQELVLQQGLVPKQVFLAVVLAVKFALLDALAQAAVVDKVAAAQLAQEGFLLVGTHQTLKLLYFYVKLLAFNDIPASILAEIAGKRGGQEVRESPRIFELNSNQPLLAVYFFLHFSVLALSPLLLGAVLANEAVLDVSAQSEAILAEGHIFAMYALIDGFVCAYFSELAPIAVVVVLLAHLFVDELLFEHVLFLFDFADDIGSLLVSAEGALDNSVVFDFVLGPLTEAIQMEGVPADSGAGGSSIALDDLHVAYGAKVVIVLILLLKDHVAPRDLDFGIFEEIFDFVIVDSSIGDDISELLVVIFVAEDEGVVFGDVEDIGEGVQGMDAVPVVGTFAGALELIADGDLELGAMYVFEYEAGSASDTNQVKLLSALEQHLDFLFFQLLGFLFARLRHTTINIIRSSLPFWNQSQSDKSYGSFPKISRIQLTVASKGSLNVFVWKLLAG